MNRPPRLPRPTPRRQVFRAPSGFAIVLVTAGLASLSASVRARNASLFATWAADVASASARFVVAAPDARPRPRALLGLPVLLLGLGALALLRRGSAPRAPRATRRATPRWWPFVAASLGINLALSSVVGLLLPHATDSSPAPSIAVSFVDSGRSTSDERMPPRPTAPAKTRPIDVERFRAGAPRRAEPSPDVEPSAPPEFDRPHAGRNHVERGGVQTHSTTGAAPATDRSLIGPAGETHAAGGIHAVPAEPIGVPGTGGHGDGLSGTLHGAGTIPTGTAEAPADPCRDAAPVVRHGVNAARSYPPVARRRRLAGTAVVDFETGDGGSLRAVRLSRTSGWEPLDAAALDAVRSAAPFPAAACSYSLAIEFRLAQ